MLKVEVVYTYTCEECGITHTSCRTNVDIGSYIPSPELPVGWKAFELKGDRAIGLKGTDLWVHFCMGGKEEVKYGQFTDSITP